ncbi:MAG: hypothetical protein KatS3mg060_0266 [Dehalococcoidia bacterium]|nr:MAG: hypothetical protein KatS3mg060_0266 [Dehalococcoidia bacterium]
MAKRTAPGRTAPKRRKERRPFIPAGTVTNPVEAVAPVEPAPSPRAATRNRAVSKERAPRYGLPLNTDYSYVARDLRRILILTGIIVAVMIALVFVLPT